MAFDKKIYLAVIGELADYIFGVILPINIHTSFFHRPIQYSNITFPFLFTLPCCLYAFQIKTTDPLWSYPNCNEQYILAVLGCLC